MTVSHPIPAQLKHIEDPTAQYNKDEKQASISIPRRHDLIFMEGSLMKGLIPSQASATRPCKCILSMVQFKKA